MRSEALSRLAAGVATREAEKPDFETFTRNEVFLRIDELLDQFAENLVDLAVDDAVEDLLLTKNDVVSEAILERVKAEATAKHYKDFERSEAERRHNIILELREKVVDLTDKYEHQKAEGLRRHNMILDLRKSLAAAQNSLGAAEKRVAYHVKERKEFLRQREYARSFRYLIKTFAARILEKLGLKKAPPVE